MVSCFSFKELSVLKTTFSIFKYFQIHSINTIHESFPLKQLLLLIRYNSCELEQTYLNTRGKVLN